MSDWQSNEQTLQRVKELLLQAGIPLEMKVSEICRLFASRFDIMRMRKETSWKKLYISTGRLVYTHKTEQVLEREIDQVTEISSEIPTSGGYSINLRTCIPIECKHREGIEAFGFHYPSITPLIFSLPTISELTAYHSQRRFLNIPRGNAPSPLTKEPLSSICLLQIVGGRTPQRVHEENLIYKAGAALCDFIMSQDLLTAQRLSELYVERLGIMERFKAEYQNVYIGGEDIVVDKWENDVFERFNTLRGSFSISQFLPVVCIDAPLYSTDFKEGKINGFQQKTFLRTDVVLASWPRNHRSFLINSQAKPIVTITNPDNLRSILESGLKWHRRTKQIITQFNTMHPDEVLKWPLKAVVTRAWRKQVGYES